MCTQVAKILLIFSTAPVVTTDDAADQPTSSSSISSISGNSAPPPPSDPALWPANLSDQLRTDLACKGPAQVEREFEFPKSHSNRSFHYHHMFRKLANGEKVRRNWLTYSKQKDAVYCFCCKLFSRKSSKLNTEGQNDWVNISAILKSHETSPDHGKHLIAWKELELRLKTGKTIDQTEMSLLQAEQNRWREVLTRLITIIQSLAERNLALRGSVDTLNNPNNGNFLKEVELLAKFDPVLKEHVRRITAGEKHTTYLGKSIQNELIASISGKILSTMVTEIKQSKYFAIILDCTPDISHQEQMSVVVRIVTRTPPEIKDYFLGFLPAPDATGLGLSSLILIKLEELGISFQDCRGQSYDNGSNMKGKNKGVQARLIEKNCRALYVPCGTHTLNLMVADSAKQSTDAISFFGVVQKLYTLFSAAPQRWAILKQHVNITLKSWSETRWESRIKSIEPLRYQTDKVREALTEVREKANDPAARIEAQSLAEEIGSFRFQICTVVWFDILSKINITSKLLQSPKMQLDVAVDLIDKTKTSLKQYRFTGFSDAQTTAREVCENMNVEAELKQKRLRNTKKQFSYEARDETVTDALKRMEMTFFNVVVDTAIQSLEDRFTSLRDVRDKFGVLLSFSDMDDKALREHCELLGNTLTEGGGGTDLDWREPATEIQSLPNLPKTSMTTFELLTFIHQNELTGFYPNLWVALRIACTLPVTVASAERSFSKLKLIKTYLRSSMSEERLSGLAVISINHQIGSQISYDDVINDFASQKARRPKF